MSRTIMSRHRASRAAAAVAGTVAVLGLALSVLAGRAVADRGVDSHASGGGHYLLSGTVPVQFAFSANAKEGGAASGRFHHKADSVGVEFHGEVTCLAVDAATGRAWIGGVVTQNNSTNPAFQQAIHEPGRDIWFRVLDSGEGRHADDDRTTFVGFEGSAGLPTSAAYCAARPWPDGNARTWPVTSGNVQVKP